MNTPQFTPKTEKRVAIIGTAESWRDTPFNDPTLECWTLNDAYCLGFPRIDRHFELHPLDKMVFRPKSVKVVSKDAIPPGHYMRPEGHIEWLKRQAATIPVYLQNEPPADWPVNARRFPLEQVQAAFGDYWASGPSYMVALAILEGVTELHVYGIHLATEQEYRDQRSNFEHLLGLARGRGITVVMADKSPVLRHPWRYAYEDKPQPAPNPYDAEWKAVQKEKAALVEALVAWPAGKDKTRALARLQRLRVIEMDIQQQLSKRAMGGTLAIQAA